MAVLGAAFGSVFAAEFSQQVKTPSGAFSVWSPSADGWRFDIKVDAATPGVEVLKIALTSETDRLPPAFVVSRTLPLAGTRVFWSPHRGKLRYSKHANEPLPSEWMCTVRTGQHCLSETSRWLPLYAYVDDDDNTTSVIATSECEHHVRYEGGVSEGSFKLPVSGYLVIEPESTKPQTKAVAAAADSRSSVRRDVAYSDVPFCRLDVKWPAGETNFPTVVWFHGGGLTGGTRHFIAIDERIAQVAVDYRLMNETNGVKGADCIADAAAAVAWTLRNVASFGGDPKKVFVAGYSAGGYLTEMVGMDPKYLAAHGFKPTDLAGLVPISGQATTHFAVRTFAGDRDPQFLPKIDDLAPLAHASSNLPPIVAVCGAPPYEWPCRAEENRLLISSCRALGHKSVHYVELPLCDHGRAGTAGVPYVELLVLGRLPE